MSKPMAAASPVSPGMCSGRDQSGPSSCSKPQCNSFRQCTGEGEGGRGRERGKWRGRVGGLGGQRERMPWQEVRVPLTTRCTGQRKGSTAAPLQRRLGECSPAVPGLAPAPPHWPLFHLRQLVGALRPGKGRRENRSVERAKQREVISPPNRLFQMHPTHNPDVGLAASSSPENEARSERPRKT